MQHKSRMLSSLRRKWQIRLLVATSNEPLHPDGRGASGKIGLSTVTCDETSPRSAPMRVPERVASSSAGAFGCAYPCRGSSAFNLHTDTASHLREFFGRTSNDVSFGGVTWYQSTVGPSAGAKDPVCPPKAEIPMRARTQNDFWCCYTSQLRKMVFPRAERAKRETPQAPRDVRQAKKWERLINSMLLWDRADIRLSLV